MQIRLHSRHAIRSSLRRAVAARIERALRRLRWLVPQVSLDFDSIPNARGGATRQCRLRLSSPGLAPVIVTACSTRWSHAIDQALPRAIRALLERRRRAEGTSRSRHAADGSSGAVDDKGMAMALGITRSRPTAG